MTIDELVAEHQNQFEAICQEPSAVETNDPNGRADRLVVAQRHLLCCFILQEATESDMITIARSHMKP